MRARIAVLAGILAGGPGLWAQRAPQIDKATPEGLANRVETKHTVGIEAGLLTADGRTFLSVGAVAKNGLSPNKDTMFEISSITKAFTALLLADMVERGEVAMDDPVSKYQPETVKVPARNGRQITLADLTTHTSGLPPLPSNIDATNLDSPYASYDAAKLYTFLSGYKLTRDPGAQWEHSNLGVGLLGHALARRGWMSYEQLVTTRILDPLGMKSTTILLTPNAPLEVTDVTAHLMEPRLPLPTLDPVRTAIQLPEETLASYVEEYQLAPTFSIAIEREGQRFFEQITNQARFEIFPEKKDEFFLRVVNAQISFTHDEAGTVNGLILRQNGANQKASRVK